jgi:hypothetical protein
MFSSTGKGELATTACTVKKSIVAERKTIRVALIDLHIDIH